MSARARSEHTCRKARTKFACRQYRTTVHAIVDHVIITEREYVTVFRREHGTVEERLSHFPTSSPAGTSGIFSVHNNRAPTHSLNNCLSINGSSPPAWKNVQQAHNFCGPTPSRFSTAKSRRMELLTPSHASGYDLLLTLG